MEFTLTNPNPAPAARPRAQQTSMFDGFDGKYTGPATVGEYVQDCAACPEFKKCPLRRSGVRGCGKLVQ